jgi:membrane protein DedA with SNARE-associated domain
VALRRHAGGAMIAEFLATHAWTIYIVVFIAPFIQEDAAVVGAASAAVAGQGDPSWLFSACLFGLIISDGWKYWAGVLAHRWGPAAKLADDPRVAAAKEGVLGRLGLTLLAARFVPGTRIPLYVACGLFQAPFAKFLPLIVMTGALYLGLTFAAFAALGEVVGEQMRATAAPVVVGVVILVVVVNVLNFHLKGRRAARP